MQMPYVHIPYNLVIIDTITKEMKLMALPRNGFSHNWWYIGKAGELHWVMREWMESCLKERKPWLGN